jgi:hypothetical protein
MREVITDTAAVGRVEPNATAAGATARDFVPGSRGGFRTGRPVLPGIARQHARFYDAVSRPTIRVLRKLGAVSFLDGCCAVGALDTCGGVWRAYDARRVALDDKAGFDVRRRIRGILGVLGEDEPDWVLERYIAVFGRPAITARAVRNTFQERTSVRTLRRLKVMAGIPVPPEDVVEAAGWGERGGFRSARPVPVGTARHDARLYDAVSKPSIRRLRQWGVIGFEHGFTTVGPDDTCLDVWNAYDDGEPTIDGLADFELRRRIRVILKMSAHPQSDRALRRYLELFGPKAVTEARIASTFGRHCLKDSYARLERMAGLGRKKQVPRTFGTPEDVIAILPAVVRQRFRDHLKRERFPAIPPIDGAHASRVARLPDGPIRLLGAMALIDATAGRRARATRSDLVKHAERWAGLFDNTDLGNARGCRFVMRSYFDDGCGTRDTELTRLLACDGWFRLINASISCAGLVLGTDAHLIIDRLPALRATGDTFGPILTEARLRLLDNKPVERTPMVADVIARLMVIQSAVENRVYQLEALLSKCMEALPKAAALLDQGLDAGFEWTGPVIRADGTLGRGEQTVSFSFRRESTILMGAHERDPDDANLRSRLPRRQDDRTRFNGLSHQAETWDRIHVIYDRTVTTEPDGEALEPFFIEFFRWGAFEPDRLMSDLVRGERLALLDRLGLSPRTYTPDGFLTHGTAAKPLALYARGRDPREQGANIIVPLVPFYHAMAYARIMLRYGIRWGARLGEIMQLRLRCQRKHRVRGREKPYLELKPKGWQTMGKFGIDEGTAKAIAQVRAFTCARWFGWRPGAKGRPDLPVVPYGDTRRDDLGEAAYIFQGRGGALSPKALSLFARILLSGVVDMRSHDGRYVFATALGLDGVDYEELGVLLHHSPASAMPKRYDLSALIRSEEAAERFNRSVDAGVLGLVADG